MNSTKAIYQRLIGSTDATEVLDTFRGLPAVFEDMAPDDYLAVQQGFCIVIAAPTSDTDASTLTETIREVVQEVRAYGKRSGSIASLGDFALLLRDLFHLQAPNIEVEGGSCNLATATGPVVAPTTDPALVGRRVTLRLQLKKD